MDDDVNNRYRRLQNSDVNNGFGELPSRRGDGVQHAKLIGGVISLIGLIVYRSTEKEASALGIDDAGRLCVVVLSVYTAHLIKSLYLLFEERKHLSSRYGGSMKKAFRACLIIQSKDKAIILVLSLVGSLYYWKYGNHVLFSWHFYVTFTTIFSFVPTELTKAEFSQLNETKNKHVADGLAWSYYFGYLKFTLRHLNETISLAIKNDFSIGNEDLRDKLSSNKVFIVIPRNGFANSDFEEDSRITSQSTMPTLLYSRAGVRERPYRFTCYKIAAVQNDVKYILLEYATPCLSMWEMAQHEASNFHEEDLEIQIKEFVVKLKQILDSDPNCVDKYELILTGNSEEDKLADVIYRAVENID